MATLSFPNQPLVPCSSIMAASIASLRCVESNSSVHVTSVVAAAVAKRRACARR